ncbi:hypothetical protein P22_2884 [Propionispora sp. 2/2-37]|uniref:hypothetical protein n=1 Tax=Propionispora sp. 2/2-37 TaxID=1677858 RepID=UPI0006BB5A07|nr:hypothetical protein [Propionispora sp. 2/2-37]CUH96773.1 hypothetical protein P22_2884 [Propionispora sp. 2/2-37]
MKKKLILAVMISLMTCLTNYAFAEDQESRQAELDKINERLNRLESQADKNTTGKKGNDKVKISGNVYIQAEGAKADGESYEDHSSKIQSDITITAQLPLGWEAELMQRSQQPFSNTGDSFSTNTETLTLSGPLGGGRATFGRMYFGTEKWDVLGDTWVTGGKFDFGDQVKASLMVGRLKKGYPSWKNDFNQAGDSPLYRYLDVSTNISPKLNLDATVHEVRDNGTEHAYEANVLYKMTPDLSLLYRMFKTSLPDTGTGNQGYAVKLTYGNFNLNKAHSQSKYIVYRKLPTNSQINTGNPWLLDKRTLRFGYNYMIEKNLALISFYDFRTKLSNDEKEQGFRLRLQAWF